MGRRSVALALGFALSFASPTLSQQPAPPDLTRFRAFADPIIGSWTTRIRDFDENGTLTWEDTQRRVFAYTVSDEFLEERALFHSRRAGRDIVGGLHLFSYDPARNELLQQGYWPGTPGILFTARATLSEDNRRAEGVIEMPGETGFRARRRLEIVWQSPNEVTYRAFGRRADGAEFLNEELVYRRAPS